MKQTLLLLISAFLLLSCEKESFDTDSLQMEVKIASGMCGSGIITVSKNKTVRDNTGLGCTEKGEKSSYNTTRSKYEKLLEYVKTLDLFDVDQNDCARCLDGVDYIFEIKDGQQTNTFTIAKVPASSNKYKAFLGFVDTL